MYSCQFLLLLLFFTNTDQVDQLHHFLMISLLMRQTHFWQYAKNEFVQRAEVHLELGLCTSINFACNKYQFGLKLGMS